MSKASLDSTVRPLKEKILDSLETRLCHVMFFFWKLSCERMFCWSGHMRGCFAEDRPVVFSWKLSCGEGCDVLLERMLERTHDVWKGYKYNPTDSE